MRLYTLLLLNFLDKQYFWFLRYVRFWSLNFRTFCFDPKILKCNNLVNLSIFSPFIAFLFALFFNLI